jgi:hypothetical protein
MIDFNDSSDPRTVVHCTKVATTKGYNHDEVLRASSALSDLFSHSTSKFILLSDRVFMHQYGASQEMGALFLSHLRDPEHLSHLRGVAPPPSDDDFRRI